MAKNKQSNLIAIVKMLNIGFISEHIIYLGIGGGGYLVLVNYKSPVSKFFPLAPPPHLFFSIKYRRNRLLCEFSSTIGFYDLPACKQES